MPQKSLNGKINKVSMLQTKDLWSCSNSMYEPRTVSDNRINSASVGIDIGCNHSKDGGSLLKAFIAYVRPLLEYASQCGHHVLSRTYPKLNQCNNHLRNDYQNLATLHTQNDLKLSVIDSLELHRLHYDLVYVYNMLSGLLNLTFNDYFTLRANSTTRGHNRKLFLNYSQLNIRKHFFVKEMSHYGTILNVTLWILQISDALRHRYYHVI